MTYIGPERRQFGRRTTSIHAWIHIDGRARIACRITDLSPRGARLKFQSCIELPLCFVIKLEGSDIGTECEIRHDKIGEVGVIFVRKDIRLPKDARIDEVVAWLNS